MLFGGISLTYSLIELVVVLVTGLVLYYKWCFTYWKKRGVEYLEPSIPFGNTQKLYTFKASFAEQFGEFYHQFRQKNLKHGGVYMFGRPFYIPVDPYIVKDILQKDFSHFVDRGFYVNEVHDPLSGNLFSLEGSKWKNLRAKLSATFTSGKMKMMFEIISACAKELDSCWKTSAINNEPVNIKDILSRFTADVISTCAFGLDGKSLKDPDAPLRYFGKRFVENTTWENIKVYLQFAIDTKVLDAFKFKITKPDVEDFMLNWVNNTVNYREKNNIYRKDFLHLLLQLKNRGKLADDENIFDDNNEINKEMAINMDELTAQVLLFFVAGFETSATTMTFALYELSKQPDVQEKLRNEIYNVLEKHNNELTYEAITEMTYLDQVVSETLRMHPPLPFLNRKCTKPYHIPNTDIHLEKGTMVVIPILGLQNDPEYFPEPSRFDPDRFSEENKNSRPPCTWMPFGEGPRICIGLRFGLLQSKIGLVTLLRNYKMTLNDASKAPLVMTKRSILTASEQDILLDVSCLH